MKLIGYVDGIEVNFDFYPPNTFKAIIPKKLDGKYILELQAEDDAGNIDCSTGMYIYIDFQHMKIKVLSSKYQFKKDANNLRYKKIDNIFSSKELDSKLTFKKSCSPYSYKELII